MSTYFSRKKSRESDKKILVPALIFLVLGVGSVVLLWMSGFGAMEAATPTKTIHETVRGGTENNPWMLFGSGVLWALALVVLACHFAREDPETEKEQVLFVATVLVALVSVLLSPGLETLVASTGVIVSVSVLRAVSIGSWRDEESVLKRAVRVARSIGTSTKILGAFLLAGLMVYLLGNPGAATLELQVLGSVAGVDVSNPDRLVENITQTQVELALAQYNATSQVILWALLSSPMTPEEERVCKPMIERNMYAIDQSARQEIIKRAREASYESPAMEPISRLMGLIDAFKKYYPVFAALSFLVFMGIARAFLEIVGFLGGLCGALFLKE